LLIDGELTADLASPPCWLCGRPLGRKVERHHPVPKSRGGRATVAVHPICHCALHAIYSMPSWSASARRPARPARIAAVPDVGDLQTARFPRPHAPSSPH